MSHLSQDTAGLAHPIHGTQKLGTYLDQVLAELVPCFSKKEVSRSLLYEVGRALIIELADDDEVNARLMQWRNCWQETLRLEAQPMA